MATESPRRRKPAAAAPRKLVKATVSIDVETHARWAAAAALRGMDRSAFAVEALKVALKGIVLFDRRSSPADVDSADDVDRSDAA